MHGDQRCLTKAQIGSIGHGGTEVVPYRVQRIFVKNLRERYSEKKWIEVRDKC